MKSGTERWGSLEQMSKEQGAARGTGGTHQFPNEGETDPELGSARLMVKVRKGSAADT